MVPQMKIERLIRNTIFTWQAWFLRKKLHRKSPTLADLDRKEADERRTHGRPGHYAKAKRDLMTALLAGKAVR